MNKYLLPIYHSKLKPWIKYWLYKHTGKVPVPVLSDWTEGYSPIEIPNAFPDTTLQDLSLIGNTLQLGTPTPTNPISVNTVSGSNTITLNNTSNYKVDLKSKNLFDRTNATENTALVWTTGLTFSETNSISTDYIQVEIGKKYNTNYNAQVLFYDQAKSYLGALQSDNSLAKSNGAITKTFTVPDVSDIYYVKLGFRTSLNGNANLVTADIMLNEGSSALPYEPYYNYELCKIGDYEDKIYKENDKWYIEKNVGKYIIDIQAISSGSLGNGNKYSVVVPPNKKQDYQAVTLCNNAKYITVTTDPQDGEYYQNNPNFVFVGNSTDTLSTIQAKYNGGFLYYQLAEATTTEITSGTTLYSGLEALVTDMKLTSGNNKIKQTNADLPFYLLFKYYMKG